MKLIHLLKEIKEDNINKEEEIDDNGYVEINCEPGTRRLFPF